MATFVVKKKIELAFLGEGWEQAYITFSPFSFADNEKLLKLRSKVNTDNPEDTTQEGAEEASNNIITLLQDKFIEGKGYDGEKLVDITKDNLKDLPMEIINEALSTLQGKKALPPNA